MTPILENAILSTDLDAQFHDLLNVNVLDPVPSNLATADDIRLSDVREPIPGSVVNASVAADAAIDQTKLNLNGQIPTAWLGTASTTAAQGNLAEYLSNKNAPGGYCGLDSFGKVPSSRLPDSVGLATVTSIALTMPAEFNVTGSPVTGAGTLAAAWLPLAGPAWFGRVSGTGVPTFQLSAIPAALVPNLAASQVTSGTFATARLPLAVGVGGSHAIGAVPDPGASGTATDYLARDMTYKTAPTIAVGYQPTLATPVIVHTSESSGDQTITVPSNPGFTLFYSITSAVAGFAEFPASGAFPLPDATTIWIYAARPGYNNSAMATYTNP